VPGPANFRLLRLGREYRGLTQSSLARAAGVSQPIVSRLEGGLRQPSSDELDRLANALHFPVEFFREPDSPTVAPLFRKRAIRSAKKSQEVHARVNAASMAAGRIFDAGINLTAPLLFPAPGELPEDPLEAAAEVRRLWRLPAGPIDDVTRLVEAAGGVVLYVDFGTDAASATMLASPTSRWTWFLLNSRETAGDRVRLSLAHELGHALLHRFIHVDGPRIEDEAFKFATALLLPPEEFDHRVRSAFTLQDARELKWAFRVSVQAIVRTAHDRGLITRDRYQSLFKQLSARGWRKLEPDPVEREAVQTWTRALEVHRTRHGYTDLELAQLARLDLNDLRELFPGSFGSRLYSVGGGGAPRFTEPPPGSPVVSDDDAGAVTPLSAFRR
jgi:Zn-dependent peptidase ImmA (M78 family)/DNA-binding XRE family transcriptional regulator